MFFCSRTVLLFKKKNVLVQWRTKSYRKTFLSELIGFVTVGFMYLV